jgi:predicted nucleic acid-binding protein
MIDPLLVDTSVWIDFFNGTDTGQVTKLVTYIQDDEPLYLCPTIIQEVLQGIADGNQCKKIKDYLMCFNVLNDDSLESALGAVKIYRKLRKKGISIRKSNDCLIAQYAFKYNLKILHKDRDFDMIIKYYK